MRKSAGHDAKENGALSMPEPPVWVLDTNVVVSGLLSPAGCPGRLLDMVLARRLTLALDDRVEAEYREVLGRPKFRIPECRLEAFLAMLQFQRKVIAMPWRHAHPPDPDDTLFLEVAEQSRTRILVTGNARHFPDAVRGSVRVLTPTEAWREFAGH